MLCQKRLTQMGVSLGDKEIFVYPNPITLDSIKSGRVLLTRLYTYPEWLKLTQGRLDHRVFWQCICRPKIPTVDGGYAMYIDVRSGEVLHVDR